MPVITDPTTGQKYTVPDFDSAAFNPANLNVFDSNPGAAPADYSSNFAPSSLLTPSGSIPLNALGTPMGVDGQPLGDAGAWNAAHPGDSRPNSDFYTPAQMDALNKSNATDPLYNFVNSGPTIGDAFRNVGLLIGGSILGGGLFNALGAGAAGAAGATSAGALGADAGATVGALGTGTAGTLAAGAGTAGAFTVPELTVTALATQGLSVPAIVAATGLSVATVSSILANGGGATAPGATSPTVEPPATEVSPLTVTPAATTATPLAVAPPVAAVGAGGLGVSAPTSSGPPAPEVSPLIVNPPTPSPVLPAVVGAGAVLGGLGAGGGGDTPLPVQTTTPDIVTAPTQPLSTGPSLTTVPPAVSNVPDSLATLIKNGDVKGIGDWIVANPLKAAELGLLASSALGTVAGGGSAPSGAYTPVKLPASFSATSPAFRLAGRGDPRLMAAGTDWTHYGQGPEQSFFTGVNQPAAIRNLAVQPASQPVRITSGSDPYVIPDRIHKKPVPQLYAHGGYAVKGPGNGRSDSIEARLSDGEYVMDAETVAMLGDGSNKAGADKLDHFRVQLRKAKGRNLAKGEFSVHAKDPMAYMPGGR